MLVMGLAALVGIAFALLLGWNIYLQSKISNMPTIEHPADLDRVKLLMMLTEEEKERFENEVKGGLYYVKHDCD